MSEQMSNNFEEMLKHQQEMLEQIMSQNKKIQRRLTIIVVAGYVKFFLVLFPLLAAIFFLPPLLKQVTQQYSSLLGISSGANGQNSTFDAATIQKVVGELSQEDVQEILGVIGR
jgi:hypothetical protein